MHYVDEEAYLKAWAEFKDYERLYFHVQTLVTNWNKYRRGRKDDLWGKIEAWLAMLEDDLRTMQTVFHSTVKGSGAISEFESLSDSVDNSRSSVSFLKSYLDNLPVGKRSEDTVVIAYHLTVMGKDLERMTARLRYPYVTQIEGEAVIHDPELAVLCANVAGAVRRLMDYISDGRLKPEGGGLTLYSAGKVRR